MGMDDTATEATKAGYRLLREAVFTVLTQDDAADANSVITAAGAIEALVPIMCILTARDREAILDACVRRLQRDKRIPATQRSQIRLVAVS